MITRPVQISAVSFKSPLIRVKRPIDRKQLQRLQGHDIYFSNHSTRSKIDRFLDTEDQTLLFHFSSVEQASHLQAPTNKGLLIQKIDAAQESTEKPQPQALQLSWLRYQPIRNTELLSQAYQLPFAKPTPTSTYQEETLGRNTKTGEFLSGNQLQQTPILQKSRVWVEKILHFIQRFLPLEKIPGISLEPDGTFLIAQKWRFQPVHYWEDSQHNRYKIFNLSKLPNGMIVERLSKDFIGEYPFQEGIQRKIAKETILTEIDKAEAEGFHLSPEASPFHIPTPQATEVIPSNDFQQRQDFNPFAAAMTGSSFSILSKAITPTIPTLSQNTPYKPSEKSIPPPFQIDET